MTLKDQMESDLSVFFNTDEFGETITYNGASITGIVTYGKAWSSSGSIMQGAILCVKVSDVASPEYWDAVVISGTTWNVFRDTDQDADFKNDGYVWELPIITDERPIA